MNSQKFSSLNAYNTLEFGHQLFWNYFKIKVATEFSWSIDVFSDHVYYSHTIDFTGN